MLPLSTNLYDGHCSAHSDDSHPHYETELNQYLINYLFYDREMFVSALDLTDEVS